MTAKGLANEFIALAVEAIEDEKMEPLEVLGAMQYCTQVIGDAIIQDNLENKNRTFN